MYDEIRELTARFGYPVELERKLVALREILERAYGSSLRSVILCGSIATGDFVWMRDGSAIRFLSDIDGLAFVDGDADISGVSDAIRNLSHDPAGSALFHVDVPVGTVSGLRRLPRSFQVAEIRKAGWVLGGEDVRPWFPADFDPASARMAFFYNLSKPFLLSFLKDNCPDLYLHVMARQILDVAILACSEEGECIPGHGRRAQAFLSLPKDHALATPAVRSALEHALQVRQGKPVDPRQMEAEQEIVIRTVVRFLVARSHGNEDGPVTPHRVNRLLAHRTLREAAKEVLGEFAARRFDLVWLMRRKEALAGAALLEIYEYRAAGWSGPAPANARRWLAQFSGKLVPNLEGDAFAMAARRSYWAGELRLHPAAQGYHEWMEPLIGAVHA
jgi:hypothetical protein